MNLHRLIPAKFRNMRMKLFAALYPAQSRVLDLGGTELNWRRTPGYHVVLLNYDQNVRDFGYQVVHGDGKACPFSDFSFDIVFSNSTIEHVGDWKAQKRLATEIRRLAPHYFVQTPNKWFPIEPHVLAPFIQFLPDGIRLWACRWLSPVGLFASYRELVLEDMQRVRLLTEREMRKLFPDAEIRREKLFGLTKSLIAFR